jgi:hypothetical protein
MRLRRVLLDSVGHPDARFDPLLLDFRGSSGQALDTVLWLRNAGGKTSLLSLIFSVLLPNKNLFLGFLQKGRAKSIEKYVLPDDVAHVALEWEDEGLPGFGAPFVTAVAMAQRPESGAEDGLTRLFYGFRPVEGTFGLEDLPIREGGRRTPFRRYRELLEEIAGRHASTELAVIRDHQGDWHEYLERSQLDPEMFRYQLNMNRDEGGAVKLLERFSDADTFIDFLVDIVSNPVDAAEVSQNLAQVADKIEQRPLKQKERDFVAGIVERLRPLATRHRAWRSLREEHVRALLGGSRLRRRLAQSAEAADALAAQQKEEAARQKTIRDEADRLRATFDRQANALHVEALRFRVEELRKATTTARDLEQESKLEARAWEAAEILVELNEVEARAAALHAALAREEKDAEGLREQYEGAAMALRRHLEGLGDAATAAAKHAEEMAIASGDRRDREGEREIAAAGRVVAVGEQLSRLDERLADLTRRIAALVREGVIEREETATAALVRVRRRDLAVRARLEAVPGEQELAERERDTARSEAADLGERIANLRGRHEQLCRDRDQLLARAGEIGAHERTVELAGHEGVDVFVAGNALSERLVDAVADAERRLVEIQVEALEDRRALDSIEETSLLPAAISIEQAVARLQEDKLSATTGWQYLAQNVRRDRWPHLLATSPELLDAVVVQPGRLERAAELLDGGTFASLTGSLTVIESAEFERDASNGRRLWTLPPAPARYDPESADDERGRREALVGDAERRLETLTARRDADHELLLRIRQLLTDCPPGHLERLAFELERQGEELDRLRTARSDQQTAATTAAERLRELIGEERRLASERVSLGKAIAHLEPLVAQEEERESWLERRVELAAEKARQMEARDEARLARQEAQAQADRWSGDAAQARNDARMWSAEIARLPHFEVDVDVPEDTDLDTLQAEYRTLRDEYEQRTSRSQVAFDARAASARAGEIRSALRPYSAVEPRARELLALSGTESTGFRADRRERARQEHEGAIRLVLTAEQDQTGAEAELKAAAQDTRNLTTLPDDLRPRDHAHARRLFDEATARTIDERARRDAAETARAAAEGRAVQAAHEHELLRSEERHLAQSLGDQAVESQATYDAITAAAAKHEVERVVDALREAANAIAEEEREINRAATSLRQFAGRSEYDELQGPYRERLTDPDDRALAGRAEDDLVEFERRLPFLDHQLAEIEKHQSRVSEQLLVLVDDAVQNLRWLQRQEMPDELGQWSGQHYFQIRFDLPETHDERKVRIDLLLDEVVSAKSRLRGTALLQRALRAVNRRQHFEVNVLKPNEGLRLERVSVAEIGAWSGGQKLTTAILIYCALARLRADNRAHQRSSPVGVLLLDNPIGTANLSTLIDLQRLVAQKFGVQLIYTTGIDDKPALAPFTNVIRLGNRRERRRERGHIVQESEDVTVVDAARIFRRDDGVG